MATTPPKLVEQSTMVVDSITTISDYSSTRRRDAHLQCETASDIEAPTNPIPCSIKISQTTNSCEGRVEEPADGGNYRSADESSSLACLSDPSARARSGRYDNRNGHVGTSANFPIHEMDGNSFVREASLWASQYLREEQAGAKKSQNHKGREIAVPKSWGLQPCDRLDHHHSSSADSPHDTPNDEVGRRSISGSIRRSSNAPLPLEHVVLARRTTSVSSMNMSGPSAQSNNRLDGGTQHQHPVSTSGAKHSMERLNAHPDHATTSDTDSSMLLMDQTDSLLLDHTDSLLVKQPALRRDVSQVSSSSTVKTGAVLRSQESQSRAGEHPRGTTDNEESHRRSSTVSSSISYPLPLDQVTISQRVVSDAVSSLMMSASQTSGSLERSMDGPQQRRQHNISALAMSSKPAVASQVTSSSLRMAHGMHTSTITRVLPAASNAPILERAKDTSVKQHREAFATAPSSKLMTAPVSRSPAEQASNHGDERLEERALQDDTVRELRNVQCPTELPLHATIPPPAAATMHRSVHQNARHPPLHYRNVNAGNNNYHNKSDRTELLQQSCVVRCAPLFMLLSSVGLALVVVLVIWQGSPGSDESDSTKEPFIPVAEDPRANSNSVSPIPIASVSPIPIAQCPDGPIEISIGSNCQLDSLLPEELDLASFKGSVSRVEPPGPYAIGSHIVSLVFEDDAGNTDSCNATIVVTDALTDWKRVGNRAYRVRGCPTSWSDAYIDARVTTLCDSPAHLATITSIEERDLVRNLVNDLQLGNNEVWLGGFQPRMPSETESEWHWVHNEGKVFDGFTDWDRNEPNGAVEYCMAMLGANRGFRWGDRECAERYQFVEEVELHTVVIEGCDSGVLDTLVEGSPSKCTRSIGQGIVDTCGSFETKSKFFSCIDEYLAVLVAINRLTSYEREKILDCEMGN